jgi:Ca-activated chloride channel family protein
MGLREPGDRRSGGARAARWALAALLPLAALAALAASGAARASPAAAAAPGTTPPGGGEPSAPPREVVFVVDASAAAAGAPLEQAKAALAAALARLRPVDTFNVLAVGARTRALFPASWPARPAALERAARWIDRLEAEGGAELPPALAAALAPPDEGYGTPGARPVREVVVITGAAARAVTPQGTGLSGARSSGRTPAGGAALPLGLGAGLALFAAAVAHALRRGLAAPEAVRSR